MIRISKAALVAIFAVPLLGAPATLGGADPSGASTQLISVGANGTVGSTDSFGARVSGHGRFVAFTSTAPLTPDDTNGVEDAYLRDRLFNTTRRISADSEAPPSFAGINPAVSDDGQIIVYIGHHAAPLGARQAVFVRDFRRGTLTRVSPDDAFFCWDGGRQGPTISADGSTVAFGCSRGLTEPTVPEQCFAVRLSTDVRITLPACGLSLGLDRDGRLLVLTAEPGRIQVLDLATGKIDDLGPGEEGSISGDGRLVAFSMIGDGIFVRDRVTDTLERVSVSSTGTPGDQQSSAPAISPDGRFVAFESAATNLVPGDTNGAVDVFLHDRKTGVTVRVDVDANGTAPPGIFGVTAYGADVSAGGRVVTFTAQVPLKPTDTNGASDVYARVAHVPLAKGEAATSRIAQ
jgi:Tol biopolymer transport system component